MPDVRTFRNNIAAQPMTTQTMPAPAFLARPLHRTIIFCLLLILGTFTIYFPALHNDFVNYDDNHYILENSHIQAGLNWKTIRWATTAYYESNWHPVTWISHAADISFFHFNPGMHHAINILLHALNAVLLFVVLRSATSRDWESFFVAALFAFHPINVESVAWASERKNVLSMFFLLVALYAYEKYARRPSVLRYSTVAIPYALGLAAKPQIITLPLLLLLWDFWPLQRWTPRNSIRASEETRSAHPTLWTLCREKLPLILLSIASAAITMQAQARGGAVQVANAAGHTVAAYSLPVRLENAIVAYARYFETLFWPAGLAPMYPHPGNELHRSLSVVFSAILLVVITTIVLIARQKKYLPVGWFWFLISLIPMIGIVQVGSQAMADRYAYLPFIGLFCILVWGISDLVTENDSARKLVVVCGLVLLMVSGAFAHRQTGFWRNSETLWNRTLRVTERNFVAHDALAEYLMKQGRFSQGCAHYQSAVGIYPEDMPAQEGLAICAQARGNTEEAIQRYDLVIRLAVEPHIRSTAFANLGSLYRGLGDYKLAKGNYEAALQLDPDLPIALVGTGLLAQKGWDYSRAAAQFAHAMKVQPTSVGYLLLANALQRAGQPAEAEQAFQQAQRLSNNLQTDQKITDDLIAQ
jgi:Flp pilus assembly protein TadD